MIAASTLLGLGAALTFWSLHGELDQAAYANGGFGLGLFLAGVYVLLLLALGAIH